MSVTPIMVRQRFRGSARFGKHCADFLLFNWDPSETFTCSFVFHEHVNGDPSGGPCIGRGALMLWQRGAAEGVEHHCPLVSWAGDQHVVNSPVVLVQAIVFGLPPAEACPNGFGIIGKEDVHKAEIKRGK